MGPVNRNLNIIWVSDLLSPNSTSWNIPLIQSLFLPSEISEILKVKIYANNDMENSLIWAIEKNGEFTVKSVYNWLQNEDSKGCVSSINPKIWTEIWKINAPERVKFFL